MGFWAVFFCFCNLLFVCLFLFFVRKNIIFLFLFLCSLCFVACFCFCLVLRGLGVFFGLRIDPATRVDYSEFDRTPFGALGGSGATYLRPRAIFTTGRPKRVESRKTGKPKKVRG